MVNPTNQPSGNASDINNHYPEYLQSYEALEQYVRGQLDGLSTTEKGLRFARTVQRLVPQTEVGLEFNLPALEDKISNDEGIDLTAKSKDGRSKLFIQSKLVTTQVGLPRLIN